MRRWLCWITFCAALAPAALLGRVVQKTTVVLDNVRVVDGTGAPPIERGRIVIEGDRVVSVGLADAVAVPPGAERIDLTGKTITPGLIDRWIGYKREKEIQPLRMRPHPLEFSMYYDI